MVLTKNGQVISLDNVDHIEAFKASGWAEIKPENKKENNISPNTAPLAEEPKSEPIIEVKAEPKAWRKPAGRKKQER